MQRLRVSNQGLIYIAQAQIEYLDMANDIRIATSCLLGENKPEWRSNAPKTQRFK